MTRTPPPPSPHEPPRSFLAGAGPRAAARRQGATDHDAVPRIEHVRVTAPDLARRAALATLQKRMVFGVCGFVALFGVLAGKLIDATVINPVKPNAAAMAALQPQTSIVIPPPARADITDRDGRILAVSLPGAALYADPQQIDHPARVAEVLAGQIPGLNQTRVIRRLTNHKRGFAYIDRHLTALQELTINRLGIPGLYFENTEHRHYLQGKLAAHILGGVTPAQRGIAGVEAYFTSTLVNSAKPLRLSVDIGIESIVQQEVEKAMTDYGAIGACGIVMSARTGRILAMASLPGYNANDLGTAPADERFSRCVSGNYEPGSVFKLMTVAMALNSGMIHYWDRFDTSHPLHVGRFTVTDFEPVHTWLAVPHILAVSSNIGASRIATILGPKIQRAWLRELGFFSKPDVQLPEAQPALYHTKASWKLLTTMTVSFGNGIAMSPLQMISAAVPVVNGGIYYHPTLLAAAPGAPPPQGRRVMSAETSLLMRKLMRNVVTAPNGTGVNARVPGYLVGGKTGTAQVVGPNGRYMKHLNNASFMAAFPMNDPRYVVYVVVLHPHATKKMMPFCHGYTTGGYVAAPAVARIIAQLGPKLGIMPLSGAALASAQAALAIPLDPPPPPGQLVLGPGHPFPPGTSRYAYMLAGARPRKLVDAAPGAVRRGGLPAQKELHARLAPVPGKQAVTHETSNAPVSTGATRARG